MTGSPAAAQAARWLKESVEAINGIDAASVAAAAELLLQTRRAGGTIFTAGNGGSAATASHLALDLQKAGRGSGGKGTRALSLADSMGLVTAWGNDAAFDRVFAEQLEVLGKSGDALVVISVSGSSPNLVALLDTATRLGIRRVGLLGRTGGAARALVDVPVLVASDDYGWVESAHVALHHVLTYAVRDAAAAGRG
ncbi:MAG TPA: SIS domain-containing protein [Gemmatimonadales bacterium]|nr:SIS domain-containing protein [Gemmatimonadales bacterium]